MTLDSVPLNVLAKIRLKLSYRDRACLRMTSKVFYDPFSIILWRWLGIATVKRVRSVIHNVGEGYVFYPPTSSGVLILFIPTIRTVKIRYMEDSSTDVHAILQQLILSNTSENDINTNINWTVDINKHCITFYTGISWTIDIASLFMGEETLTVSWVLHKSLVLNVLRGFLQFLACHGYHPSSSLYRANFSRLRELKAMWQHIVPTSMES